MNSKVPMKKNVSLFIPLSEKEKDFGMVVSKISCKEFLADYNAIDKDIYELSSLSSNLWFTPIVEDYFQMFYINNGQAFIKTFDFQGYVESGYFIIIPPNEKFSIEPNLNKDYKQYSISFSGYIPNHWIENKYMLDKITPIKVDTNIMEADFNKLLYIASEGGDDYQIELSSQVLFNLNSYFYKSLSPFSNEKKGMDSLMKIKKYFEDNLYVQFNIEDMCDSLEMNYYQLRNYFNAKTGMSPYKYLLDMKIHKAMELLDTNDYSIKEISYKLAFDSQYYFSRLFKKKTGVSPTKWINRIKEEKEYF